MHEHPISPKEDKVNSDTFWNQFLMICDKYISYFVKYISYFEICVKQN